MLAKLYLKLFHMEMMRSREKDFLQGQNIHEIHKNTRESFNVTLMLKNNVNVQFIFFPKQTFTSCSFLQSSSIFFYNNDNNYETQLFSNQSAPELLSIFISISVLCLFCRVMFAAPGCVRLKETCGSSSIKICVLVNKPLYEPNKSKRITYHLRMASPQACSRQREKYYIYKFNTDLIT